MEENLYIGILTGEECEIPTLVFMKVIYIYIYYSCDPKRVLKNSNDKYFCYFSRGQVKPFIKTFIKFYNH